MNSIITAIASFIIALLSGLGIGSGGLLVIWLTAIEHMAATDARSLNLLFFLFSAGSALTVHLRKRDLKLSLVAMMSFFGILGTLSGTYLGIRTNPEAVRKIFGGMLVLSGIYTFFSISGRQKYKNPAKRSLSHAKHTHFGVEK